MNMEDEVRKLCEELQGTSVSDPNSPKEEQPQSSTTRSAAQEMQKRRRLVELDLPKIPQEDLVDHIRYALTNKNKNQRTRTFSLNNFDQQEIREQYPEIRNRFMLSEWLIDIPEDFEKWIMIPCPQAPRNLVIAHKGVTQALTKTGLVIDEFPSHLPGGSQKDSKTLTILDCFFDPVKHVFYILDMICWADNDYTTMELDCRLFLLKSYLETNRILGNRDKFNPFEFHGLPWCCCTKEKMKDMIFNCDLGFDLDGCLFYFPKILYIPGQTSLIGWLLPWMFPEILNIPIPARFTYVFNKNLRRKPNERALEYIARFESINSNKNMYKGGSKKPQESSKKPQEAAQSNSSILPSSKNNRKKKKSKSGPRIIEIKEMNRGQNWANVPYFSTFNVDPRGGGVPYSYC